ncbi:MAG TPA: hypothetical protein VIK32_12275 [Candidatus Limnocylindrales bacterium]
MSTNARLKLAAVILVMSVVTFGVLASPALARRGDHLPKHRPYTVKVIERVGRKYKLPRADIQALIVLAYRESSWNPRCVTGNCYGLFQVQRPCGSWRNPAWNTGRAIRDIRKVYKTPRRALAHSFRHGWY